LLLQLPLFWVFESARDIFNSLTGLKKSLANFFGFTSGRTFFKRLILEETAERRFGSRLAGVFFEFFLGFRLKTGWSDL
jgi:hypothetical protein